MSNAKQGASEELLDHVEETLGNHRETLEKLADLDTQLSDDAERALQLLEERRD